MAKTKPFFEPLSPNVDFPKLEEELLKKWNKEGTVKRYLQKNENSKKNFSFLDGPITANNPMGVHHAWGRTYKDLWQRFYNMRGFKQRFQNGFDCQGLWVEVEVEKELGLKSKKDIENLVPGDVKASIAKFVELCRQRVYKYAKIQTEQSKRLGYFMDWDNSYFTLSEENNYMIWHFLKKCNDRGLIYKGRDSVPWCPRCGTAISQHEILTEDYRELTHETVFFKVPVKDRDFSLLAWTTTPWTIPANVALAINPKFKYRVWKLNNKDTILTVNPDEIADAESREWFNKNVVEAGFVHEKGTEDILGKDLVGLKYEGPFDDLPRVKDALNKNPDTFHSVIDAEDLVVATKGTGILHVAPGAGEEDYKLGKEKNLSVIDVINEEANYYDQLGEFSGKNAKRHPEIIIDFLKSKDEGRFLLKTANITHRYPACWRCKTELVWRVVDEWYIAIDPVREDMKKVTKRIRWIPGFGLKRELDWLKNMHDWLISKKRYWGLAIPIWECKKCGNFEVIGSYEELKEKAVDGWEKFEGHTPHKPWVDEVRIKCSKCGEITERIPDVGNPWLDAGIVSFSTISKDNKSDPLYWSDKEEWQKWFPADFITESFPGQFKNWFYSLIAMSAVLENREPFKTVLGFATLLAEDGRPMHKSWGNAIEFNEGAEKIGVDVMRWMYVRQNPSDNLLFGYKIADETRRKFHLTLWNIYNFFVTYANLDDWHPVAGQPIILRNLLDVWVTSRLQETLLGVTKSLEDYDARSASQFIEDFVQDMSLWYIRRSRNRVGLSAPDATDKKDFYIVCHFVLVNLTKILAPFTPFLADIIFTNLVKLGTISVHLIDWPDAKFVKNLQGLLGEKKEVKKLMKYMHLVRSVVEKGHSARKEARLPVRQPLASITIYFDERCDARMLKLIEDELNVKEVIWKKGKELKIKLDTKITPELEEEAKTRELIRKIQGTRKEMGITLTQKVTVLSPWLPLNKDLIQRVKDITLTRDIGKGDFEVKVSN
ncbi:MAG: Isoleucyl-tRNA synthetase [Candidatus Woesebacteria bacterium GW2011_GWA1_39_12]|uniref:Isoleucine--tRNA ligase n=2 Tax=Candidatus Woeseibacteriota TaxID=1752722 RepID=A0A0G0Q7W1_9BACT|nr:MAG: Isoleucyl-tRNA synthetase [Candidatus Woesebacteria bacterium GW2011_GWA1_39_12]